MEKTFGFVLLCLFLLASPIGSRADCVSFKDLNAKDCSDQDAFCFSACVPDVHGATSGRCILVKGTG
jgi:hypothetical protein